MVRFTVMTNLKLLLVAMTFLGGTQVIRAETRDPLKWPFAATSIWNMPIGSGAVYSDANIPSTYSNEWIKYLFGDDETIVMSPTSPKITIYHSTAGWSGTDRCSKSNGTIVASDVPWPSSFEIPSSMANASLAVLLADGVTVFQTAPFAKCSGYAYGTAYDLKWKTSLLGDGRAGSHGGSGLSAIGGALRVGTSDLITQAPRHALAITMAEIEMSACNETSAGCGRWPAYYGEHTGYGSDNNGQADPDPPVGSQNLLGSLLAIRPSVNCENIGLETQPGKWLCWTLQNYGGYTVDTTPEAGGFGLATAWEPSGKYKDTFQSTWGYSFEGRVRDFTGNPWLRDVSKIAVLLHVVSNNSATSIGGGGAPRQPLAPPFLGGTKPLAPLLTLAP